MSTLHRLATELEQVRSDRAGIPQPISLPSSRGDIAARLRKQLGNLRRALGDPGRHATEARTSLRTLIDRVTVTPLPMLHEDARGCGPMSVQRGEA